MMKLKAYSEKEFNVRFEKSLKRLTRGKTPVKSPKAYLLGGQSGSGKTTLHSLLRKRHEGNIIVIDNDTFKPFHPRYSELVLYYGKKATSQASAFSGEMTEKLIATLSSLGYHLVIEGTLRTTAVPLKTAKLLKAQGYTVGLYVMAVPFALSYLTTLERYERMFQNDPLTARYTPRNIQEEMKASIVSNLSTCYKQGIFDEICLYDREENCLYDSHTSSDDPSLYLNHILNQEVPADVLRPIVLRVLRLMCKNKNRDAKQDLENLYRQLLEN